jgi:hypothetical protein
MLTPSNSDPGSYVDFLKRTTQHVQQTKIEDQILELIQQAVEKELDQQKIVLSRPERVKLSHQVTKAILNNVLVKMNGENTK